MDLVRSSPFREIVDPPQEQRVESVAANTGIPSQYQREHTNSCLDMVRPKRTDRMALSDALAQECEEMAQILAWSRSEQEDNSKFD